MALGYLDGNTGSLIATVLVGGTAGAAVAMRSARAKVGEKFGRRKKGAATDVGAAPTDAAPTDEAAPGLGTPPPAT
jgi:hypothetical protein